jgi:hypothetical protein
LKEGALNTRISSSILAPDIERRADLMTVDSSALGREGVGSMEAPVKKTVRPVRQSSEPNVGGAGKR